MGKVPTKNSRARALARALAAKYKVRAQKESKQKLAMFVPLRKPVLCSSAKTTFLILYENQFLFCTRR
jgi:hypothetical protein